MAKAGLQVALPFGIPVGVLGGGQLARMLALAAHPLGMAPYVLCEQITEPAAQVTQGWLKGHGNNAKDLETLLSQVQTLTFESEFFDLEPLKKVATKYPEVYIYPHPEIMQTLQDRRTQKAFLDQNQLPTAPWCKVTGPADLPAAAAQLGFPFVVKKAQGGYDGYGTFFVRSAADFAILEAKALEDRALWPAIAEKAISFKRELAFMVFRSRQGDIAFYPLIETVQKDSRCDVVSGPYRHRGIGAIQTRLKKALKAADYVGALGVEMFEAANGKLLINELAPRVHNTGHYSQNVMNFDQFQLHLLCGLNRPLPRLQQLAPAFVMTNLIGHGQQIPARHLSSNRITGALHWYGKSEFRRGRKLGHINYWGKNLKALIRLALRERRWLENSNGGQQ